MSQPGARIQRVSAAGWRAHLTRAARSRELIKGTSKGGHHIVGGQAVEIEANNWQAAQRALRLILAAMQVNSGQPPLHDVDDFIAYSTDDPESVACLEAHHGAHHQMIGTTGVWRSCEIAAAASRRMSTHYAVIKYQFSHSCFGAMMVDLEPSHGEFLRLSDLPYDHVRFAHAILAAHSLIEDLGLEVRASATKPSRINREWNPVVKEDLERRLTAAGVDLTEPLLWTIRGPSRRRLDTKRRVAVAGAKYSWSRGWIRDAPVQLIDAIAHVDWLRDKVASHGVKNLTKSLSPYDVTNTQHLARRLVLEVLGFWRRM